MSRAQALGAGLTTAAIDDRLARGRWQRSVPGIYLTVGGEHTVRQRLIAGLLHAGPGAALDDVTVLAYHGCRYVPADRRVLVVVPHSRRVVSSGFVVVRRTTAPLLVSRSRVSASSPYEIPWLQPAAAAVWAGLRLRDLRTTRAILAEVVQLRLASPNQLLAVA